jgi:hypothetical protein
MELAVATTIVIRAYIATTDIAVILLAQLIVTVLVTVLQVQLQQQRQFQYLLQALIGQHS